MTQERETLDEYKENPNHCEECAKPILLEETSIYYLRATRFCSNKCISDFVLKENRAGSTNGGRVMAIRSRQEALFKYYENPKECKHCGSVIQVKGNQKLGEVRAKKFCCKSCAAKFNNRAYPKRRGIFSGFCRECGDSVSYTYNLKSKSYSKRKYCIKCLSEVRSKLARANQSVRYSKPELPKRTKGSLKVNSKYWVQYRSKIQKHAKQSLLKANLPKVCAYCGYSLHVDTCHIKDVKDFPDTATVEEINSMDNLVYLCKNHQWEFDNGYITKEDISRDLDTP